MPSLWWKQDVSSLPGVNVKGPCRLYDCFLHITTVKFSSRALNTITEILHESRAANVLEASHYACNTSALSAGRAPPPHPSLGPLRLRYEWAIEKRKSFPLYATDTVKGESLISMSLHYPFVLIHVQSIFFGLFCRDPSDFSIRPLCSAHLRVIRPTISSHSPSPKLPLSIVTKNTHTFKYPHTFCAPQ